VDMGSAEIWELFAPFMEVARRLDPYSVGYGKFRSGLAIPSWTMIHNTKQCVASGALGTASDGIIPNIGQFGGYCGGRRNTLHVRFDNIQEMIQKREPLLYELGHPGELKERIEAMGGRIADLGLIPAPMEVIEGDMLIASSGSGGGLGDPIERDPASIKTDLDNGLATQDQAENIYCVRVDCDEKTGEWSTDLEATRKMRIEKRAERLERGVPAKDWWRKAREKVMAREMDSRLLEMYQSSARLSPVFADELKAFWALPDDFDL